jgi:E1A/CREB-binding protein
MKPSDVRAHCTPIVDDMIRHANGYIFATPVDPVKLMIPDYPDIIKRPMDLGTIRKRLDSSYYRDLGECANDIRLTFDNAMLYNPMHTDVHKCARHFKTQFEKNLKIKVEQIEKATEDRRVDQDSCRLCGDKDLYFELPNYYCNGKCASRIKRNTVYYSDDKNTLHWCMSCYNDLRDPIKVVGAANISKKDLKKGKLTAETEEFREPMVCCDGCDRWVHCLCGLFNSRRNLSKEMQYFCPSCVLQQRAKLPAKTIVPDKKMLANTLPHCLLSEYIEKRVASALEREYAEHAVKLGIDVSKVEKAPALSIRQVSCIDNNQATQEGMRKRYAHKNYPVEFPCRAKCIIMFQDIDGQDVILFGMYVYEYGHKCPQPNQRRVYISYLDSVHYLRPRQYRTPVYHEILIAYLEYVKMRGFHTAHIWACPPMPKDDYIFNIHPPDQKTPKQERLRQWYVSMLDTCVKQLL